jgi:RNA polymerase sigma factor (sigma-70 family)
MITTAPVSKASRRPKSFALPPANPRPTAEKNKITNFDLPSLEPSDTDRSPASLHAGLAVAASPPADDFFGESLDFELPLDRRIDRILKTNIEFQFSPEFEDPDAATDILDSLSSFASQTNAGKSKLKTAVAPPPGTPPYLADLYAFPLLTREQEHHLFRKMNYLKYRAGLLRKQLSNSKSPSSLCDRIEKKLSDALLIRNRLVQCNLRLVVSIAKTIARDLVEMDELISDGNLPLIRAVEIFDFERGTRFSTYATWAIRHFLYRASTKSSRLQKRFVTSQQSTIDVHAGTSDEPGHAEMNSLEQQHQPCSLLLEQLDDRSRSIVSLRFGLGKAKRPHKFREIAQKWGVSTERVRQLFTKAIGSLQNEYGAQQGA